jgi:hypothetical protein
MAALTVLLLIAMTTARYIVGLAGFSTLPATLLGWFGGALVHGADHLNF